MSDPIAVTLGKHEIKIHCPHVENGACSDCIAPQVVPYVAARQTLDVLLPKMAELSAALREIAKATDRLHDWVEKMAKAKWELGAEVPDTAQGCSGEDHSTCSPHGCPEVKG